MLRASRSILGAWLLIGSAICGQATADDAGQADLDKATETKLSADENSLTDLNEVVRLLESALEKGLSGENTAFANQLLSATLVQRGALVAKAIFESVPPNPRWQDFRRVALEDLERAVKLDAQQPEALYMIARLNQLPGGDAKRAKETLDLAAGAASNNPRLRAKILVLRAAIQEDVTKKLADLDEAIRTTPGDPALQRARGLLHAQQGQHEKALADFDAALALEPDHAPTLEAKATTLAELKRYDEALASIARLRQLEPESVVPLVQEARIQALQGNREAALHNLDRAEQLDADNAGVLLLRGMVYQEMKENDKALADVERALKLRPDLPMAMRLRAALLASSGKFDQSIEQLSQLLKTDPEDVESRLQLAMFYQVGELPQKAVEQYSEVLKRVPDHPFGLRGRGDALLSVGKHTEAIVDYEKALEKDPNDTAVLNNLAWVLATSPIDQVRNGKRAIELATKACELTEYKQAHILSTLGAAYAETGDFETAKNWSRKAIEIGPDDQKEALQKELASYEASKPIREMQTAPEKPEGKPQPAPEAAPKAADPSSPAEPSKPAGAQPDAAANPEEPQLLPSQEAKPVRP